jgi:putative transposase
VKLRYNERIYPTAEQQRTLARFFGCARVVYNDGLRARQAAWKNSEGAASSPQGLRRGKTPVEPV